MKNPRTTVGSAAIAAPRLLCVSLALLACTMFAVFFEPMMPSCLAGRFQLKQFGPSYPTAFPIMPWDRVNYTCTFEWLPNGAQVWLHYMYNASDVSPPLKEFPTSNMLRMEKARVPFTYWTLIPPSNAARIYLHTNIEVRQPGAEPEFYETIPLLIGELKDPVFTINSIEFGSINVADRTVPMRTGIHIYLPLRSDWLTQHYSISVEARDPTGRMWFHSLAGSRNRFQYADNIEWLVNIDGNPLRFPFDNYKLDLDFGIWASSSYQNFSSPQAPYLLFQDFRDELTWDHSQSITLHQEMEHSILRMRFVFRRREENTRNLTYPILGTLFVLGASVLLDVEKRFQERLGLYTALAVFALSLSTFFREAVPAAAGGYSILSAILNMILVIFLVHLFFCIAATRFTGRRFSSGLTYVVSNIVPLGLSTYILFELDVLRTEYYHATLVELLSEAGATILTISFLGSMWICLVCDIISRCWRNRWKIKFEMRQKWRDLRNSLESRVDSCIATV